MSHTTGAKLLLLIICGFAFVLNNSVLKIRKTKANLLLVSKLNTIVEIMQATYCFCCYQVEGLKITIDFSEWTSLSYHLPQLQFGEFRSLWYICSPEQPWLKKRFTVFQSRLQVFGNNLML